MKDDACPHSIRDYILWAERRFLDAGLYFGHGTDNVLDEAVWLVDGALGLSPDELEARLDKALDEGQQTAVRALVEARIRTRRPAAYLLQEAWFAGLPFFVDERVIVPRSHLAEFIEERFQPWTDPGRVQRILDLGTGCGCIAIATALAFPQARVDAADISAEALAVARINVEKHGLRERVRLIQSDVYAALPGERYDLIVSNPPYVNAGEMADLPDEYRHEPALALAAGADGLAILSKILAGAGEHLQSGGILAAEAGNSAPALQEKYPETPFIWLTTSSGDESVFLLSREQLTPNA